MPHLRQRLSARWTRMRRGVPERGEVWQVDFGTVAKVRPALVISVHYADADRALIGVIPHTTSTRGSQFEVVVGAGFLGEGAFLAQGIQAFPPKYFMRRLGVLTPAQLQSVEDALLRWLGVTKPKEQRS